ncbi:MAG: Hsp20/alpha crystallin family protein [Acidimicrobiales bacterium]|nr:Hsp20/alpha crystallin family protein [Acidimicrobiales bacterium]MBO0886251.1 Hsp20/alpha crystallin family protein [Acidimicrobiales bacterium]
MLLRYDPFRELDRLTRQLSGSGRPRWSMLPMDAWREGDHFVARFDLPGVDPRSIDVSVDQNVLTVKAERSWSPAEGDEVEVSARERFHGRYFRRLALSERVDSTNIEAGYDAGVLTLTIPVAEKALPRKVTVNVGPGADQPAVEASAGSEEPTPKAA